MLRVLKTLLFLVLFVGFIGGGFYGFQYYLSQNRDGGVFEPVLTFGFRREAAPQESAELKRGSDLTGIVAEYRAAMAAAKAAPGEAAVKKVPDITPPGPNDKVIREWRTGRKWIALTFDDGPHPEFTPQFIELLKSKGVPATFFLIGKQVESFPQLVKDLVDNGFEVANHSWSHPQLTGLKLEKATKEIADTTKAIEDAAGVKVELIRPPYGATNKKVLELTDSESLRVINWNIDTNDWRSNTTADSMTSGILKYARDGSIVLMHDRYQRSLDTTARVIDELRAQGYEFVTVSELLGLRERGQGQPKAVASGPAAPAEQKGSVLPDVAGQPAATTARTN